MNNFVMIGAVLLFFAFVFFVLAIVFVVMAVGQRRKQRAAVAASGVPTQAPVAAPPRPVAPVPAPAPLPAATPVAPAITPFVAPVAAPPAPAPPPPAPPVAQVAVAPALPVVPPRAPVSPSEERTVVISAAVGSLLCTGGKLNGQNFPIPPGGVWIGREAATAGIVVPENAVSKKHVWVGIRDGQLVAVDEASTNGTFLRPNLQSRITTAVLTPGTALVIVSESVAVFEYRT